MIQWEWALTGETGGRDDHKIMYSVKISQPSKGIRRREDTHTHAGMHAHTHTHTHIHTHIKAQYMAGGEQLVYKIVGCSRGFRGRHSQHMAGLGCPSQRQ